MGLRSLKTILIVPVAGTVPYHGFEHTRLGHLPILSTTIIVYKLKESKQRNNVLLMMMILRAKLCKSVWKA